jgi:hypothetical protein
VEGPREWQYALLSAAFEAKKEFSWKSGTSKRTVPLWRNNPMACRTAFGILLVLFCGCTPHYDRSKSDQQVVGHGTVAWHELNDKVCLIVWWDFRDQDAVVGSFSSHSSSGPGGATWDSTRATSDGRKFDLKVTTDIDGRKGDVVINGEKHRLEDGRIFLVTTRGPQPGVEQIRDQLDGFRPTWPNLDRLAESEPKIKEFVAGLKAE